MISKVFARLGLPGLVGEIIIGMIVGPNVWDVVPHSDALVVIGDSGLILFVLQTGIDVDIGMLKLIGASGLYVALFGSMIPLLVGTGIGYSLGLSTISSISIGACLAPTAMSIALHGLVKC